MVSHRARLLAAAAIAGGVVGSLSAQPPSGPVFAAQSFEVLPPRRLPMPASIYDSENVPVGYFSTSQRQNTPAPAANPTSWLNPPRGATNAPPTPPRTASPQGVTVMPLFGKPQPPGNQLASATPANAPAWRWHGYGSVGGGVAMQYSASVVPSAAANPGLNQPDAGSPALTMPTPVPMPMPAGPVLPSNTRSPGTLPPYSPPPGPVEAVPLQMGPSEPSWKPMDGRSGSFRSPPRTADPGVTRAGGVASAAPVDPWTVSRAAFVPTPEPAALPPAPTTDGPLVVLRSTIETICAGRGRELEMFYRGPNNLLIRTKVRVAADAEQLANLISKLPEIAPYHVTYEIAVAP